MKRGMAWLFVLLSVAQGAPAQTTFHGNAARTGAYESGGSTDGFLDALR
ncbi:MAG TPA: hypothetical protein VGC87_03500 [Pyrinomonadaceae bacterium]|jgi:hypothetical protein